MSEEIMKSAMSIILNAGDARVSCKKALDALAQFDFETANVHLQEAQKMITEAHVVQTQVIQSETLGEESEYSLLFSHAQDTLMTINSEINLAKQLMKLFEAVDVRFKKIEDK